MSGPNLHNALLRPPIIQILRAAGFHATRPSVLDTLADLTARYMMILASSVASHAANAHPNDPAPAPVLEDVYQALQDVGALRPQLREWEEDWQGEEDIRGLENFLGWFTGPANREIRRVAGFLPSEGDMIDPESLEKEDFLTALKKKHSKTGEESRYAGTVLGKSAEEHPIVIEGGVPSIQEWSHQVRSRAPYVAESDSSGVSSAPSNLSEADGMEERFTNYGHTDINGTTDHNSNTQPAQVQLVLPPNLHPVADLSAFDSGQDPSPGQATTDEGGQYDLSLTGGIL